MGGDGIRDIEPTIGDVKELVVKMDKIPQKYKNIILQALADKQEVDLLKLKNRVEAGKNRVNRLFKDTMKDDVSKNLLNANPDLVVNGRLIVYEDTGASFLVFKKENYQLRVQFFSNELGRIYSTVTMIEPYDIDLTEQYELLKDFFLLIKNAYPDLDLNLLTDFSEHEQ